MCSCIFCSSPALGADVTRSQIVLPVVIRTSFRSYGRNVVGYLTKIDGPFVTIVFGNARVYDKMQKAAAASLSLLDQKQYSINGWQQFCIKIDDNILVRIKHVRELFVNSSSSDVIPSTFPMFCSHQYRVGDKKPMRTISRYLETDDWVSLTENFNIRSAIRLMEMRKFPQLMDLGPIVGTDQYCTIAWNDTVLKNVKVPRRLLVEHPDFTNMAKSKRQRLAPVVNNDDDDDSDYGYDEMMCDDDENMSYYDQIRNGKYVPIVRLVDKQGDDWVIRVRDADFECNVTISKFLLKGTRHYDTWFKEHDT